MHIAFVEEYFNVNKKNFEKSNIFNAKNFGTKIKNNLKFNFRKFHKNEYLKQEIENFLESDSRKLIFGKANLFNIEKVEKGKKFILEWFTHPITLKKILKNFIENDFLVFNEENTYQQLIELLDEILKSFENEGVVGILDLNSKVIDGLLKNEFPFIKRKLGSNFDFLFSDFDSYKAITLNEDIYIKILNNKNIYLSSVHEFLHKIMFYIIWWMGSYYFDSEKDINNDIEKKQKLYDIFLYKYYKNISEIYNLEDLNGYIGKFQPSKCLHTSKTTISTRLKSGYYLQGEEILARIMEIRAFLNLTPLQEFNNIHLEQIDSKIASENEWIFLFYLKDKNSVYDFRELMNTIF